MPYRHPHHARVRVHHVVVKTKHGKLKVIPVAVPSIADVGQMSMNPLLGQPPVNTGVTTGNPLNTELENGGGSGVPVALKLPPQPPPNVGVVTSGGTVYQASGQQAAPAPIVIPPAIVKILRDPNAVDVLTPTNFLGQRPGNTDIDPSTGLPFGQAPPPKMILPWVKPPPALVIGPTRTGGVVAQLGRGRQLSAGDYYKIAKLGRGKVLKGDARIPWPECATCASALIQKLLKLRKRRGR